MTVIILVILVLLLLGYGGYGRSRLGWGRGGDLAGLIVLLVIAWLVWSLFLGAR